MNGTGGFAAGGEDLRQELLNLIYSSTEIERGVNAVLARIGTDFHVSRVYIFENNEANTHSSNTFEWCAEGIQPEIDNLQEMSFEEFDYQSLFDDSGICFCPDVSALPPVQRELFEAQGILATLQYAIYDRGEFRGLVGFDDCVSPRYDWRDDEKSRGMLIYVSQLLSICLLKERNLRRADQYHRQLEESLEKERQLREEALRANEAKSRFLSNISHDMRTPLNGIIGFTRLAMDTDSIQEKNDCLQKIAASERFLLDLINETLDLSKIETGKLTLRPEAVDSHSLFNGIVANIRPMADAKHIHLNVDTTRARWTTIFVDVLRMQEIFSNLLSNAVKFTPEGGTIDFLVECEGGDENLLHEKIIIRDSGVGMSKDFLPQVFEPFSQENPLENHNDMGTGLGLSIVKQLVTLMGGTIEVDSEIGSGTTFTLHMNIAAASHAEDEKPGSWTGQDFSGKRILICEDHPINAELLRRLLEKKHAEVDFARNGEEGVSCFANAPVGAYSAVLMDVRMPVMDGIEATMAIRALPRQDAGTVPILAMTANAFPEDEERTRRAGMNVHLAKPIDPLRFYQILAESMRNASDTK